MRRLRPAAALSFWVALWAWFLVTLHGIWTFGYVYGYLDEGRMPLTPSLPVTYAEFIFLGCVAFIVSFPLGLIANLAFPMPFCVSARVTSCITGSYIAAESMAFEFQIDFGATWGPNEAMLELFVDPVVTPIWLVLGICGTALFARFRT